MCYFSANLENDSTSSLPSQRLGTVLSYKFTHFPFLFFTDKKMLQQQYWPVDIDYCTRETEEELLRLNNLIKSEYSKVKTTHREYAQREIAAKAIQGFWRGISRRIKTLSVIKVLRTKLVLTTNELKEALAKYGEEHLAPSVKELSKLSTRMQEILLSQIFGPNVDILPYTRLLRLHENLDGNDTHLTSCPLPCWPMKAKVCLIISQNKDDDAPLIQLFKNCKYIVLYIANPTLKELHDILEGMACLCSKDVVLTIYIRTELRKINNSFWLVPFDAPEDISTENVSYECIRLDDIYENMAVSESTLCIFIFQPVIPFDADVDKNQLRELTPSGGYCILCPSDLIARQELTHVLLKRHEPFPGVLATLPQSFRVHSRCPSGMPPFFFNTNNVYCKATGVELILLLTSEVGRYEPGTRKVLVKYLIE